MQETLRAAVLPILQARLSDPLEQLAHWNVKGANFVSLHEVFDRMAADIGSAAVDTAERIVAFGGYAGELNAQLSFDRRPVPDGVLRPRKLRLAALLGDRRQAQ